MSEKPRYNLRKRQKPHRQQSDYLQPDRKRLKRDHFNYAPRFWDNLSKIDLTKRALEELNRRNDLKKQCQLSILASVYLSQTGALAPKNFKQAAKDGGFDLSNLRGFPDTVRQSMKKPKTNTSISNHRSASTNRARSSTTSKSTSPYNRNFRQNLVDHGIFDDDYEYPDGTTLPEPSNLEEIKQRLIQARRSLSPSKFTNVHFEKFRRADAHSSKEQQIRSNVIPFIEGDIGDVTCVSGCVPFTNLAHLTDGTLVPGNPDIYYGARPEKLDQRVRSELNSQIIPSTQQDLPIAPNFFLEVKGPEGNAAVAKRQANYVGALGSRSFSSLQTFGQRELYHDNKAYTITSTYFNGTLSMYVVYPILSAHSKRVESAMCRLDVFNMTRNLSTFVEGANYYRNGRQWTKEQREMIIKRANEKADDVCGSVGPEFIAEVQTERQPSGITPSSQKESAAPKPQETDSSDESLVRFRINRSKRRSRSSSHSQRKRIKQQTVQLLLTPTEDASPATDVNGGQSSSATGLSQSIENHDLVDSDFDYEEIQQPDKDEQAFSTEIEERREP